MGDLNNEELEILEKAEKIFRYRKISKYVITGILISTFIIGLILNKLIGNEAGKYFLIITSMIVIFTGFILDMDYWRCPKCKVNFPTDFESTKYMSHCPYCGVKLR